MKFTYFFYFFLGIKEGNKEEKTWELANDGRRITVGDIGRIL